MNSVGAKKNNGKRRFVHRLSHLKVKDAVPFTDFMKPLLKVSRDDDIERALRNNAEAAERIVQEAVRKGRIWSIAKFRSEDGHHVEVGDPIPVGRISRLTTNSVHTEPTTMLDGTGKVANLTMFQYARKYMRMNLLRTDLPALVATAENSAKALYVEWPVETLVIATEPPPNAAATPDFLQNLLGRKRPIDARSESGSSLHSEENLEIDDAELASEKPTGSRHEHNKIPKRTEIGTELYGTESVRTTDNDHEAALDKLRAEYEQRIYELREYRREESELLKDQIRAEAARCLRLEGEKKDLQERIDSMTKEHHEKTVKMVEEKSAWKSRFSTAEGESGLLRERIKDLTDRITSLQAEKTQPVPPAKIGTRKNVGQAKSPPTVKPKETPKKEVPKKIAESDIDLDAILDSPPGNDAKVVAKTEVSKEAAHSTGEPNTDLTYGDYDDPEVTTNGGADGYDPRCPSVEFGGLGLSGNTA